MVVPAPGTGKFSVMVPSSTKLLFMEVADLNAMVFQAVVLVAVPSSTLWSYTCRYTGCTVVVVCPVQDMVILSPGEESLCLKRKEG